MNHYAQALAELQDQPHHQLKQIGDQWQTPKPLAFGLFHKFAPTLGPVVLDMFADHCNHLVPHYYTAADNALTQELAADLRRLGGAAYANPPYSRPSFDGEGNPITGMEPILNFCREQRALGGKIMLLIKAATSETWWPEDADFIQFISGRIGFEVPSWYVPQDPKKDRPSSSGFASAVVIFDASWQGERRPEARLRRDDLITTGQVILDLIHRQAVALNEEASQTIAKLAAAEPTMLQDQPAIATPGEWDQPTATPHIEQAHAEPVAASGQPHPDYAEPGLYLVRYVDDVAALSDADQSTLRNYLKGWFDEGETPAEICYRLTMAAANLKAGKQIHDGFVVLDRTPSLTQWQRHPAVRAVIYQIDQADILTPAKTAELAGWVINALADYRDQPAQLLELATNKAIDLLAESAATATDHVEDALEMVQVGKQDPEQPTDGEPLNEQTLDEWQFDHQNDQMNLGGAHWHQLVVAITALYGMRETYTPRQVAIAISACDEQLLHDYTDMPAEQRDQLKKAQAAVEKALSWAPNPSNQRLQYAAVYVLDEMRYATPSKLRMVTLARQQLEQSDETAAEVAA